MEYITFLKNPETHIDIGNNAETTGNGRTGLRRLCSHFDKRNLLIGVLTVFTLISFLTQLPLHMQVQTHKEQLKVTGEKIRDIIIAQEIILQSFEGNYNTEKADKKRGRQERTAPHATPHFYLSGYQRGERATNGHGIFVWKHHGNFDGNNLYFDADINSNEGSLTKVQIKRGGVYFVFATVTANGRNNRQSNVRPAVGIYLKKNDETLDVAWKTQDSRGWRYHAISGGISEELKYPLDSMSVFGLHRLEVNDEIYIQRPPDRLNNPDDRFLTGDAGDIKARFGAFLVEGCLNCG